MIIPGSNSLIHLSIPVVGGREVKGSYKEIQIDHTSDWRRDHMRTLKSVYGKSPWGIHYFDSLEHLYQCKEKFLYDWNLQCLDWMCRRMKMSIQIVEMEGQSVEVVDFTDKIIPSTYQKDDYSTTIYSQVFEDRLGFQPNMSSIDLLMNEGSAGLSKFL